MAFMKAELYHKIDCELGEGPVWDHRSNELIWVDIEGKKLHFLKGLDLEMSLPPSSVTPG